MHSILLFVSENDLNAGFKGVCHLCPVLFETCSALVPVVSSAAFMRVCAVNIRSIYDEVTVLAVLEWILAL